MPKAVKIEMFGTTAELPTERVDLLHYNKRTFILIQHPSVF